jgi:hypothetical protein
MKKKLTFKQYAELVQVLCEPPLGRLHHGQALFLKALEFMPGFQQEMATLPNVDVAATNCFECEGFIPNFLAFVAQYCLPNRPSEEWIYNR